jgi:hypothetical protein
MTVFNCMGPLRWNRVLAWLVTALFLLPCNLGAQRSKQCCSMTFFDVPTLTSAEAEILNTHPSLKRGDFDFAGKKVAFASGRSGTRIIKKYEYMCQTCRDKLYVKGMQHDQVVVFDPVQKAASGGYDAVVITNAYKVANQKTARKLVRNLAHRN